MIVKYQWYSAISVVFCNKERPQFVRIPSMFARSTNMGTSLALLAVCLQVVVAALSGQICLRMAPLPASDGCLSQCCDGQESFNGSYLVVLDIQQSPAVPTDTDCCLEVTDYYYTNSVKDAGLEDSDASFLTLQSLVPFTTQVEISSLRVRDKGPGAAQPPPSMLMIRSTVLRI